MDKEEFEAWDEEKAEAWLPSEEEMRTAEKALKEANKIFTPELKETPEVKAYMEKIKVAERKEYDEDIKKAAMEMVKELNRSLAEIGAPQLTEKDVEEILKEELDAAKKESDVKEKNGKPK